MSTPSVNLKDVAAAALEMIAQLKRDAESAADRLKRQGEESARAVTNALATLEEGLGEMSELMLAASHVFVHRFELERGFASQIAQPLPLRIEMDAGNNRIVLADSYGQDATKAIKPGKHRAVVFIIPEEK